MSARLTVVFEDEDLYRRLKVKAAEDGVPMKELIERGIRLIVGQPSAAPGEVRQFDWGAYEEMLSRIDAADAATGVDEDSLPQDLSDIKKHLYGPAEYSRLRVAEERADYNAK